MKAEIEIEPAIEPMRTRVALHPFLAGMNRSQLALLTDCAMAVRFEEGQTIFREGEIANRFYLIETGKIVLESSSGQANPVIIDTIGAGELLGWSWMFPPYTWRLTARAVEPTSAIFFYGTILREYCETRLFARVRAVQTHGPGHDQTNASGAPQNGGDSIGSGSSEAIASGGFIGIRLTIRRHSARRTERNRLGTGQPQCYCGAAFMTDTAAALDSSKQLIDMLRRSRLFRDYEHVFSEATGLALAIRPLEFWQLAASRQKT